MSKLSYHMLRNLILCLILTASAPCVLAQQPADSLKTQDQGSSALAYSRALANFETIAETQLLLLGGDHPDYATTLNDIGYCHSRLGDYEKALALYQRSLDIRRAFLGERHPDCVDPLRGIGICEMNLNDYQSATEVFNEFYSLMTSNILDDFGYLTQLSRVRYWNMYSPYFQYQLPVLSLILKSYPSFLRTAYDGVIFSKGLLLNAETSLRELILESGDKDIGQRYHIRQYRTLQSGLDASRGGDRSL